MKDRRDFLKKIGMTTIAAGLFPFANLGAANEKKEVTLACDPTTPDYYGQGPFYTPNAPNISGGQLAGSSEPGQRLIISGTVFSDDCVTPIANALLDIWHADDGGAYDNSGFNLRGKMQADGNGQYEYETILPGKYLNGSKYRPRHIHLKISGSGHDSLTTQLYFAGDTDIPGDAAASINSGTYDASDRIITITQNAQGKWEGTFDIILNNPTSRADEKSLHTEFGLITDCIPNPVNDSGLVKFSVFKPADVTLNFFDVTGKFVSALYSKKMAPGKYEVSFNRKESRLAGGKYLLTLQVNGLTVHHCNVLVK